MPHINIKHFPSLSEEQHIALAKSITEAITKVVGCDAGVVSIAVEPVDPEVWNEQVYIPEIVGRKETLIKIPEY
ncbi:tautomerase family protein [Moritella dasanensis]|jgi:4-oxalocrotonate tautomerase|uniref:tautomerase family protein n=1 Tax=Moritella dasanensis TaxID=428031 RepID=UPI0002E5D321|nr:tautomerase family protein [Moritella dasanensis]